MMPLGVRTIGKIPTRYTALLQGVDLGFEDKCQVTRAFRTKTSISEKARTIEQVLWKRQSTVNLYKNWEHGFSSCTKGLSHIDPDANLPRMVDVSHKPTSQRIACAQSIVQLPKVIADLFKQEDGEFKSEKGPVIATAIVAGTMAVKSTSQLIPFCHPLPIDDCKFRIDFQPELNTLTVNCTVTTIHKTGVEMEALCGASVCSLCIYDMCKGLSHDIVISNTKLLSKSGGKSDYKSKPGIDFLKRNEDILNQLSAAYKDQKEE